ncbi:MAG: FliA/WhiG family RNA polymerase sigma factor [Candidatus Firestonebacteria bacterium]|nr:FliA/WhiG family RNA polymerase sigma factor [Candidatus Firestonebacteria bacterium]
MEEMREIWVKYKTKPDYGTREILIKKYLGLVRYVVNRIEMCLPPDMPNSELDDLLTCGVIGLMDAIEKFDIKREVKFKTYALPRIKGAILDELRAMDWAPRSIRKKARQVEEAYAKIESKYLRPATDEEVAEALEISLYELHSLLNKVSQTFFLSLDKVCGVKENGQNIPILDIIEDTKNMNPDMEIEYNERIEILKEAIDKLPEREKVVIALYYFDELNLKEIGQILDVSESRVSQMHTKAILRLKSKLVKSQQEVLV